MLDPIATRQAGAQRFFELAVRALDHTVGLRVVGGGEVMRDAQERHQNAPHLRGELWPPV